MSESNTEQRPHPNRGFIQEITDKIVRQIEAGTIPWVQPWAEDQALSIPRNATHNRAYSGVNILLLWDALFERGYFCQSLAHLQQALQFGGNVRKGERGTTVVYADTFTPKKEGVGTPESQGEESGRRVPFSETVHGFQYRPMRRPALRIYRPAQAGFAALTDTRRRGFDCRHGRAIPARRHQGLLPHRQRQHSRSAARKLFRAYQFLSHGAARTHPLDRGQTSAEPGFHRTLWQHRLCPRGIGRGNGQRFSFAPLLASCRPFVTPNYIGNWLEVLKSDSRAIVSAASHASKASDFLLAFTDASETEKAA